MWRRDESRRRRRAQGIPRLLPVPGRAHLPGRLPARHVHRVLQLRELLRSQRRGRAAALPMVAAPVDLPRGRHHDAPVGGRAEDGHARGAAHAARRHPRPGAGQVRRGAWPGRSRSRTHAADSRHGVAARRSGLGARRGRLRRRAARGRHLSGDRSVRQLANRQPGRRPDAHPAHRGRHVPAGRGSGDGTLRQYVGGAAARTGYGVAVPEHRTRRAGSARSGLLRGPGGLLPVSERLLHRSRAAGCGVAARSRATAPPARRGGIDWRERARAVSLAHANRERSDRHDGARRVLDLGRHATGDPGSRRAAEDRRLLQRTDASPVGPAGAAGSRSSHGVRRPQRRERHGHLRGPERRRGSRARHQRELRDSQLPVPDGRSPPAGRGQLLLRHPDPLRRRVRNARLRGSDRRDPERRGLRGSSSQPRV